MCKHHWMLGQTTLDGTPGQCKKCKRRRVFKAKDLSWESSSEARRRPHDRWHRKSELPFNPHGYFGSMKGDRL